MEIPADFNETLCDLAVCIAEALPQIGKNPAVDPVLALVDAIRTRFGGSLVYIPLKSSPKNLRMIRDASLIREFSGNNHRELARRYNLTVSTVYQIIATHRQASSDSQPSPAG